MQLFYTTDIKDDIARLSAEEARHCLQVLRKQLGDTLDLVDGKGYFYKGEIIETSKKECLVKIAERRQLDTNRPNLKIAIAPTKNIDRFETFLEKTTEIGIDEIIPLRCARSERKAIRPDRLEKIILAAMKQSIKAHLPALRELTSFNEWVSREHEVNEKYIAYCNDDQLSHFKTLCVPGQSALILIGPEGDFTDDEIALAKANGFQGISLGKSRLRTETAGIVACSIFNMINS